MRIWAVTFKEYGGAEEIVHAPELVASGFLLFADDSYDAALRAFQAVVKDRMRPGVAVYEYPGDFGTDAKTEITVRDQSQYDDYGYSGDTIALKIYQVVEGGA